MENISEPKNVVPAVENMVDLQFNPKVDKTPKIKEKDIFDIEKDKKDPNSDRFYPEVAKIAKTKSMARQIKHQEVLKTGKKVRVKHNDPKTY